MYQLITLLVQTTIFSYCVQYIIQFKQCINQKLFIHFKNAVFLQQSNYVLKIGNCKLISFRQ